MSEYCPNWWCSNEIEDARELCLGVEFGVHQRPLQIDVVCAVLTKVMNFPLLSAVVGEWYWNRISAASILAGPGSITTVKWGEYSYNGVNGVL